MVKKNILNAFILIGASLMVALGMLLVIGAIGGWIALTVYNPWIGVPVGFLALFVVCLYLAED